MSCPECCIWCCPCLKNAKKTSKFSYVRYTQSKQEISDSVLPEKVFEFPQIKSDFNSLPQMFVEPKCVVRDQPTTAVHDQPVLKLQFDQTDGSELDVDGYNAVRKKLSLPYPRCSDSPTTPLLKKSSTMPEVCPQSYRESVELQAPQRRKDSYLEVCNPCSRFSLPTFEESTLQQEEQLPVLQFSLLYDMQKNVFTVHLHHASNLPEMDRRGTMNPFVVLYTLPNKEEVFESVVIHQTLNPEFNQSFEFHRQHPDDIQLQTLIFKVYDNSKSKLVGGVAFPLEDADIFGVVMRMQIDQDFSDVCQDSQGELLLALSYDPRSSSIKGVVLKAVNLKKQYLIGLADPYVKIYIYHKNTRIGKWKSTVKKNTLVPIFNDSFHFEINERDIESISMKLVMMEYNRLTRNDVMGTVLIGSSVSNKSGCKHWNEMILNPNSRVCQWHTII